MKHVVIKLAVLILTCLVGQAVTSLLTRPSTPVANEANVIRCLPGPEVPVTATPAPDPVYNHEAVFRSGRLRVVAEEVHLKSQRLQYNIDVTYPQIVGSDEKHIRWFNQRLKKLAEQQYESLSIPSKENLRFYRAQHADEFNTVDLNYDITLASDDLLSFYFFGNSYGLGAAHAVQFSFTVNYDVATGEQLRLADVFKRRFNYLEFVCGFAVNQLSRQRNGASLLQVSPRAENVASWNFTRAGLRINFDACSVFPCSEGEQTVMIPLADLQHVFTPAALDYFSSPPTPAQASN